jgi:hypothetical protein
MAVSCLCRQRYWLKARTGAVAILGAAQQGELLNIAREQKRIGGALQCNRARNRCQPLAARFNDFTQALFNRLVSGQGCVGKDQVALSVFVSAIHQGGLG